VAAPAKRSPTKSAVVRKRPAADKTSAPPADGTAGAEQSGFQPSTP
jgi:hypothetical protein